MLIAHETHNYSYAYPIEQNGQSDFFICMQQTESRHMQAWSYNVPNGPLQLLTSSICNPTQLSLLRNSTGFSFIDNGLIKIKEFGYRSEQRIDPDIPIHSPLKLHWITDDWCYLSAQYATHAGIFFLNKNGLVLPLLLDPSLDFIYPSHIDDLLFCIRYCRQTGQYQLVAASCNDNAWHGASIVSGNTQPDHIERITISEKLTASYLSKNVDNVRETVLYDFGSMAVAFLSIQSIEHGYILSHEVVTTNAECMVSCGCYLLESRGLSSWTATKLFDFSIPMRFFSLSDPECLCETMNALQPYYDAMGAYYVDYDMQTERLLPHCYNFKTKESVRIDLIHWPASTQNREIRHWLPPRPTVINDTQHYVIAGGSMGIESLVIATKFK